MGWAKFDDQFTDHPKVVAAGPMAELLAVRAVIHCARYETDGYVQAEQLPRLALGITSPKKQVAALVRVGLWEEAVGGWRVHDFLEYHPSAEQKREEREQARERMAKVRKKKDRSSQDVRPNTERTSPYPDPTPTPKDQEHPPGGNGEPFATRLANELKADFGWKPPEGATLYQSFHALMCEALERLPDDRHHGTVLGIIAGYAAKAQVELTRDARAHTARLVTKHAATDVLRAWDQAIEWGAGIGTDYVDDPLALSKYAAAVLAKAAA